VTDQRLRLAVVAVSVIGLGISGYLTYVHYAGIEPICAASGGCEKVQNSRYADLAGVPVALLGLIGYVGIGASALLRGEAARMAGCVIALVGAGFSLYLTYLELFQIHAICQWCVASAVAMVALATLTTVRALRADDITRRSDRPAAPA
jgi:uncharacterized membrane protein